VIIQSRPYNKTQVFDALFEVRTPFCLGQTCTYTNLPKSTAFRVIVNLIQGQYLTETEEGYWLGLQTLRFGALVEEKLDLKQQAHPFLLQLRKQVDETLHLAVPDDDLRVVYLENLSTQPCRWTDDVAGRKYCSYARYCFGQGDGVTPSRG
jgi:DNA-binding IclR family transcriptional regulator